MKLEVTQENLAKALSMVAKTANARNALPVLANILLKTLNNRLHVVATNLDIAVTYVIGAKIVSPGGITIPARLAQDFISSLPPGNIQIEQEENRLHISTGKYSSVINGIAA